MKNDKMHVKGIYYHDDGRKYEGGLKDGEKSGKGIHYYSNSNVLYDGDWENGNMEGKGILNSSDGSKYVGDLRLEKVMVKVFAILQMVKYMMVNGKIVIIFAKVLRIIQTVANMKVNLKMDLKMDMVQGVIEIKILNHRPALEIFQKTIDTTTE